MMFFFVLGIFSKFDRNGEIEVKNHSELRLNKCIILTLRKTLFVHLNLYGSLDNYFYNENQTLVTKELLVFAGWSRYTL